MLPSFFNTDLRRRVASKTQNAEKRNSVIKQSVIVKEQGSARPNPRFASKSTNPSADAMGRPIVMLVLPPRQGYPSSLQKNAPWSRDVFSLEEGLQQFMMDYLECGKSQFPVLGIESYG
jgi:hypothetical protein